MRQKDLLKEYETSYRLGDSFRRKVVNYIERCHLDDGGYFFARIPPSSGTDTYFAVKSLAILGVKPSYPEAVANFFLRQIKEATLGGIAGIFNAVEVINELGQITDDLKSYAQEQIIARQNKAGGFGALENIYIEVSSELEETYRAVKILKTIGATFDEQVVSGFVFSLLNRDGGYGRNGHSTLASTFYATEIHKLLGVDIQKLAGTRAYLRRREESWKIQFIEDLFWLAEGLANLGDKPISPDRVNEFVLKCQRRNGGFARAPIMGIPTLEYTFYALSILKEMEVL
jgi:hypothetical protein